MTDAQLSKLQLYIQLLIEVLTNKKMLAELGKNVNVCLRRRLPLACGVIDFGSSSSLCFCFLPSYKSACGW